MKRISYLFFVAVAFFACSKDSVDTPPGWIAGSVSDKTTGEPVATVNVSLSPGGQSTVTGSDGSFSFEELDEGMYTVAIRKEGYLSNETKFSVKKGKPTSAHLPIERIPAVVTTDIKELDFGSNASVNTLSFKIVNSGYENLDWEIEHNCPWIRELKPKSGTLGFGKTGTIVVVIDRDLLDAGENKTVLVVKSTNGSSQVEVKAIGEERVLPKLNTLEVTDIAPTSAILHGKIVLAGIPAYIERGFVYDTLPMPTLENTLKQLTAPVTDNLVYSCRLEGLTLGTTYYVRAYAKNNNGVSYAANVMSFTAKNMFPKISVEEATDVSVFAGTAVLHGKIVNAGDPAYTERGFVYGTVNSPTIEDTKVVVGGRDTGVFSTVISELSMNHLYYVRAYAINVDGITYSSSSIQVSMMPILPQVSVQKATNISVSAGTAMLHGTIVSVGDPSYTERGFVYGTVNNPTLEDMRVVVAGSGTGSFSTVVSELSLNKTYYVRAYAMNEAGVIYSPVNISFTTQTTAPEVSVQNVTNVNLSAGTAVLHGTIIKAGAPPYTERGFVYGTVNNPTVEDMRVVVAGSTTGAFSTVISELSLNKTYYVRSYAISTVGITYSFFSSQFSMKPILPQVSTYEPLDVNISAGTATLRGEVVSAGEPAYTECGFVYGTMQNPTIYDNKIVVNGSGVETSFSVYTDKLPKGKDYFVRAYATSRGGTVYGENMEISTQYVKITTARLAVQRSDIGKTNWPSAISMCQNSTVAGYSDWRLPTENELMVLYTNRKNIGGFSERKNDSFYWTSSFAYIEEKNENYIYLLNFGDGNYYWTSETDAGNGKELWYVRCVRTINN